jgi:hypothetical protein
MCPLQKKKWSEQLSTPKRLMEWVVVHSKNLTFLEWNFVYSNFCGVDTECTPIFLECTESALQKFWSGLEVDSKTFGVDLGALQIFGVNFECMIVYSKDVKNFGVGRCTLQIYWSGQLPTPKKIGVHTFPLQIGVHEVKSWSAFSLTHLKSPDGSVAEPLTMIGAPSGTLAFISLKTWFTFLVIWSGDI